MINMLTSPILPSWHSYGITASDFIIVSGMPNVHGRVHVVGSSTVIDHMILSGATRRKRSVSLSVFGFALR